MFSLADRGLPLSNRDKQVRVCEGKGKKRRMGEEAKGRQRDGEKERRRDGEKRRTDESGSLSCHCHWAIMSLSHWFNH